MGIRQTSRTFCSFEHRNRHLYLFGRLFSKFHAIVSAHRRIDCSCRDMGIFSKPCGSKYCSAAKKNDFPQKVLAVLFSHLYGRSQTPDFHRICRFFTGKKVSFYGSGSYHPFCHQQSDQLFYQSAHWQVDHSVR